MLEKERVTINNQGETKNNINFLILKLEESLEKDEILLSETELIELSYHRDCYIRNRCCLAFLLMPQVVAKNNLLRLLNDRSPLVRMEAGECLSDFFDDEDVCSALLDAFLKEKHQVTRGVLVSSLLSVGYKKTNIIEIVEKAIQTEHCYFVKVSCYRCFHLLCNRDTLQQIINCFSSKIYQTRCAVVNALDEILDEENAKTIFHALEHFSDIEKESYAVQDAINHLKTKIKSMYDFSID